MARVPIKRPRLLLVLLLVMFGQGVLFLAFALLSLDLAQLLSENGLTNAVLGLWLMLLSWVALGVASMVVTVALRGGRPWGWTLALVIEGAILILMLEYYFTSRANSLYYAALALAVAITFLLNQRDVRIFFHAHRQEQLESRPPEPLPDSVER